MTVALLEHNGLAVEVPKQDCCGLPLQSNGLFDDARGYVHRLAARLAPYAREGVDIVGTSTSCSLMLKREALEILGMSDDPDLQVVSERVFDICEYLLAMHERGELNADFAPVPETVTYHAPCQQQGHGIGKPALDLLALVPELRTIETGASCCGVAGTYGLKREKYDIAMKVGAGLFAEIATAGPDRAVCDSETCRWQIEHATGVRTGASRRDAPPRVGPHRSVVGLVIVSHSAALADGVMELAREMGGGEVAIEAAGGMEDGEIGTDAERVRQAVERVRSPDGVLVLMDLGSALMSAEMAVEMAEPGGGPILLSEAPLVEGAVAAAALARSRGVARRGGARGARARCG